MEEASREAAIEERRLARGSTRARRPSHRHDDDSVASSAMSGPSKLQRAKKVVAQSTVAKAVARAPVKKARGLHGALPGLRDDISDQSSNSRSQTSRNSKNTGSQRGSQRCGALTRPDEIR